jgi:hypothetical protein
VIEQDTGTVDQHAAILAHLAERAPMALAVHSGSKSLHGWFFCQGEPEERLRSFIRYAVTLGADRATWARSQFGAYARWHARGWQVAAGLFLQPKCSEMKLADSWRDIPEVAAEAELAPMKLAGRLKKLRLLTIYCLIGIYNGLRGCLWHLTSAMAYSPISSQTEAQGMSEVYDSFRGDRSHEKQNEMTAAEIERS